MGRLTQTQSDRAAVRRDYILALLWGLSNPGFPDGEWSTSSDVYDRWLDGRDRFGSAYWPDYIKREAVTSDLKRLVAEGRAEASRALARHPWYRPIGTDPTVAYEEEVHA